MHDIEFLWKYSKYIFSHNSKFWFVRRSRVFSDLVTYVFKLDMFVPLFQTTKCVLRENSCIYDIENSIECTLHSLSIYIPLYLPEHQTLSQCDKDSMVHTTQNLVRCPAIHSVYTSPFYCDNLSHLFLNSLQLQLDVVPTISWVNFIFIPQNGQHLNWCLYKITVLWTDYGNNVWKIIYHSYLLN